MGKSPAVSRLWSSVGSRSQTPNVCLSCQLKRSYGVERLNGAKAAFPARGDTRRRYASSLASTTAINAAREVRPPARELYQQLERVKATAGNFVNLSRLQLALRSLEANDPVVRIAILGLDEKKHARALLRLLLADPLLEEAQWEKTVLSAGAEEGKGLLIRHGDRVETVSSNTLLDTITIPAPLLRSRKIEILVSSLSAGIGIVGTSDGVSGLHEAFLVPFLETPISETGRSSPVTCPVHRTVLVGQGLESLLGIGQYLRSQDLDQIQGDMLQFVVGLPAPAAQAKTRDSNRILAVDVPLATAAIETFRQSTENAIEYERKWYNSGIPELTSWISKVDREPPAEIKEAVASLINSMLDATLERITSEESERLQAIVSSSIPGETHQSLKTSLTAWAERSHTELRYQLDVAFEGRKWGRLRWWKLFWRVDDVEMVTADILDRRWLADAEKSIIWLAGRTGEVMSLRASEPIRDESAFRDETTSQSPPRQTDDDQILMPVPRPWPIQIPSTRTQLAATTIQPLEAKAQALVLQTLSTTAVSSAFSALIYFSNYSTSIYEAGVFAVFGLVWSLRRLQKQWEAARGSWEGEVRETGRQALKHTEDMMRGIIDDLAKPAENIEGAEERKAAREAVEQARRALDKLYKPRSG